MALIVDQYKDTMRDIFKMYMPISDEDLEPILNYSIKKRYEKHNCVVENSYTKKNFDMTLLQLADYIASKEPIVTAYGTMFAKHSDLPNPMATVVQQFLDKRSQDKKMMFKFPKGSENFEKFNLLQALDKIDANGIYGVIGMFSSLLFNINVSTSVTNQGRALISSATMMFESFLANNVKFGSLDEVLLFIDNVCKEERKYKDKNLLDHYISIADCFAKIIDSCGYKWIPDESEMDIIWRVINNLSQENINRIYYKNNLYEFLSNKSMTKAIVLMLQSLDSPLLSSTEIPDTISAQLEEFTYILKEYVYYDKMWIDRIDRCDNMIKSVIAVSDTDSCIVSLDAWYRFVLNIVKDVPMKIKKYDPINVLNFIDKDEFGDPINFEDLDPLVFEESDDDYDFENDEILEKERTLNPLVMYPQDYLRYSIINMMGYIISFLINDYMEKFTQNNHSFSKDRKCFIFMKNEFLTIHIQTKHCI